MGVEHTPGKGPLVPEEIRRILNGCKDVSTEALIALSDKLLGRMFLIPGGRVDSRSRRTALAKRSSNFLTAAVVRHTKNTK